MTSHDFTLLKITLILNTHCWCQFHTRYKMNQIFFFSFNDVWLMDTNGQNMADNSKQLHIYIWCFCRHFVVDFTWQRCPWGGVCQWKADSRIFVSSETTFGPTVLTLNQCSCVNCVPPVSRALRINRVQALFWNFSIKIDAMSVEGHDRMQTQLCWISVFVFSESFREAWFLVYLHTWLSSGCVQ